MTEKLSAWRESARFTVEHLAAVLTGEGSVCAVDAATGHLLLQDCGFGLWDPPVRFALSDGELRRYVMAARKSGPAFWPDVSPVVGGFRLFLVHLDETLATRVVPGSHITLDAFGGLAVAPERPPDRFAGLEADVAYDFLSPEQYREKYGREPRL